MRNNNEIFFYGMELAYNKSTTFGVKKIPNSEENGEDYRGKFFSNSLKI